MATDWQHQNRKRPNSASNYQPRKVGLTCGFVESQSCQIIVRWLSGGGSASSNLAGGASRADVQGTHCRHPRHSTERGCCRRFLRRDGWHKCCGGVFAPLGPESASPAVKKAPLMGTWVAFVMQIQGAAFGRFAAFRPRPRSSQVRCALPCQPNVWVLNEPTRCLV